MGKLFHDAARYGVWSVFTWVSLLNRFTPSDVYWRPNYLGITLSLLVIAMMGVVRRHGAPTNFWEAGVRIDVRVDVAFASGMTLVAAILVWLNICGAPTAWLVLAVALGGFALGWLYVRWAYFFSLVDLRCALRYLCIGFMTWVIIQALLGLMPDYLRYTLSLLLPVSSFFMLRLSLGDTVEDSARVEQRFAVPTLVSMGKAWITIVTASFAISIMTSLSSTGDTLLGRLVERCLIIAVACLFVWTVLGHKVTLEFAAIWRVVFFVLAPALAVALADPNSSLLHSFAMAAWDILIPIVWVTICDIARHANAHPYTVLGIGLCMYTLPFSFGAPLYSFLVGVMGGQVLIASLFLLLFFVMGLCLGTRDPDTQRIFEDLREGLPQPVEFATIDTRCQTIGHEYGLSERQVEIMKMVCKGRPRAYIAETLFITENTVKTHLSRLYAKLDVHSQKELLDLIGRAKE